MTTIPLISHNTQLMDYISRVLGEAFPEGVDSVQLETIDSAIDFLSVEMPELLFIDFSQEQLDAFELMERIMADSWLLNGGIIALYQDYETGKRIEQLEGANIIVSLRHQLLSKQLPKILSIIQRNRRILFQRQIGVDLVNNISSSFKLENDPLEVRCYVNLVCNFLYNAGKLDKQAKNNLRLALVEMLRNAVEHGNCEINYQEKSSWLESGKHIDDLIERKNRVPAIRERKVAFEYAISPEASRFIIGDEGKGFDWNSFADIDREAAVLELHGRGIMLARSATRNFSYNEKGNEVRFEVEHRNDQALTPGLFKDMEPKRFAKGAVIFKQGEKSDYLYYIAKGSYEVLVNGRAVSTLTPDDVFMGEMSFLLNNRRSADVTCVEDGRLIVVSKKDFVEAIRQHPHYALFLSRLLAQRIQRLHERS